ncbi:MAG: ADOP family duplicated permease [Terriglobales bacterium]
MKRRMERDMQAEMEAHVRLRAAELEAGALPPAEAERRAWVEFGGLDRYQEECREALGLRLLRELRADLRQGLRQLRRNPGFTAVAVLTLALGIGANAAIFSMIEGMLLRALPYPQAQQLYEINKVVPQFSSFGPSLGVNSGNFLLWQKRCPAFAAMAEIRLDNMVLTGRGQPRRLRAAVVPANFFPMLGEAPALGRGFTAAEDEPSHNREVVLTDAFWRRGFDANPHAIGETLWLDGLAYSVVGVLPADFRFPAVWGGRTPALFAPVALHDYDLDPGIGNFRFSVIARLQPGVSVEQALAQLDTVEGKIAHRPDTVRHVAAGQFDLYATLTPLKAAILGPAARAMWLLWAAAGLLLLIVCANLANLLLAKNADRAHEVALRAALGATRPRLLRQFLTEGLLLAAAGGALGLVLAAAGLQFLVRNAPIGIPRVGDVHLDGAVVLFTLAVSIGAALLFASLPVLLLARAQPVEALKATALRASATRGRERLRGALMVSEVALCVVLLAGALLLVQSLARLGQANDWMQQPHVLTLELVTPPVHSQAELVRYYDQILGSVRTLPGVTGAAFTPVLPLQGGSWGDDVVIQEVPRPAKDAHLGDDYFVSPGFLSTIGLSLEHGRAIAEGDVGRDVAVISESIARTLLAGRNPLGMHILWEGKTLRIIGVAGDMRTAPDAAASLAIYIPLWTFAEPDESLVIRSPAAPAALLPELRSAIGSVDPRTVIAREQTLPQVLAASTAPRRYETSLGSLFALCAVVLAAIGLYGVLSYAVSRRAREIGIRMALGAQRGDVLLAVVRQGLTLALAGVAIGLAAALVFTRLLSSLLYGIRPDDPLTFLAVAVVLLAVALLASWLPARRATRLDPTVALRNE